MKNYKAIFEKREFDYEEDEDEGDEDEEEELKIEEKPKMTEEKLILCLDLISEIKVSLNLQDYITIWGEQLGNHLWFKEGDLISIWRGGLTPEQKKKFAQYVTKRCGGN